jgi:hypothetical protein
MVDPKFRQIQMTWLKRKRRCLRDYSPELRGPPNNRYGGHKAQRLRGFRGGTYGPAGPVRQFTPEEIQEYEQAQKEALSQG